MFFDKDDFIAKMQEQIIFVVVQSIIVMLVYSSSRIIAWLHVLVGMDVCSHDVLSPETQLS